MKVEVDFQLLVSDGSSTSFITEGILEERIDYKFLSFIEQSDIKALTKIKIYKDKVLLERNGSICMKMEYILNESTTVYMKTDFNYELSMNNYTKYLNVQDNFIQIIYQTEMDIEQDITHNLMIHWQ